MKFRIMLMCTVALAAVQGSATSVHADQQKFEETITVKGEVRPGLGAHALSFSAPVALPDLSLGAGTYIFRVTDRNALQVTSISGVPYAMFLTIPTTRTTPTDSYAIVMGARPAPDSPRRIVALFAPGETVGQQFVYRNR